MNFVRYFKRYNAVLCFMILLLICTLMNLNACCMNMGQDDSISLVDSYWVVTGSFDSFANACDFSDKLNLTGEKTVVSQVLSNNTLYYRVMTGPWNNRDSAVDDISRLREKGIAEAWIFFGVPDFNIDFVKDNGSKESLNVYNTLTLVDATTEEQQKENNVNVKVGVSVTDSLNQSITIGSDVLIEVCGQCKGENISFKCAKVNFLPDSDPQVLICEIGKTRKIEFDGSVTVSIEKNYKDKFIWLNDASCIYKGTFEISRNSSKGITVVNNVDIEDYVRSVLEAEIGLSTPFEALCAQAVAIRTNVLTKSARHEVDGYDICDTTHCQVYTGAAKEYKEPILSSVIEKTKGEALFFDGQMVEDANFSSTCGGITESSSAIWGTEIPYLKSVICSCYGGLFNGDLRDEKKLADFINLEDCNYMCSTNKNHRWSVEYSISELESILKPLIEQNAKGICNKPGKLISIAVTDRTKRGTAMTLNVKLQNFSFNIKGEYNIREALGGTAVIKSALFIVDFGKKSVNINGAGFGHGVGLCQSGARELARQGFNYIDILSTYYSGVVIEKIVY